jgi:phage baseplate assembly protein gpV
MNMSLVETLRAIARAECERVLRLQLSPRLGNVAQYDARRHAAKVTVQPEGVTTNWLPVASPWIGPGWGLVAPLAIGEQVEIVFPEYGATQGVVAARLFDQRNPPPAPAQQGKAGEVYLVDGKGSLLSFTSDGKLTVNGAVEIDLAGPMVTVTATTEVRLIAPVVSVAASGPAGGPGDGAVQPVKLADGSNSIVLKAQ